MTRTHEFDTGGLDQCPFMPVFSPPRVMFERGLGTELWDVDGKRYLDFLSGLGVVSLGHCNPTVTVAVAEQAGRLWHVSNLFANPAAAQAASAVVDLMREVTGEDGQVFFTNSGAEAVECAIKLARKCGGRA
jgi:acetylornithine/succinyldiaminopimelate/putrescine aminotransferase